MVFRGDSNRRVANSLLTLFDQVEALFPNRRTGNDGTIGDTAHAATNSDHNPQIRGPDGKGIITALDITHDPGAGFDAGAFAESLRTERDHRIKYVIFNGRIFSATVSPWIWRERNKGPGDHSEHVHISVQDEVELYDDPRPWLFSAAGDGSVGQTGPSRPRLQLGDSGSAVVELQQLLGVEADSFFGTQTETAVKSFQAANGLLVDGIVGPHTWGALLAGRPPAVGQRFKVVASMFGGVQDPNNSAYDNHFITDQELGCSLPDRIEGPRPKVRVYKGDKSVVCTIVDVGPWNSAPGDPYWMTGTPPRVLEQFRTKTPADNGRVPTNIAAIDLTPAAARAIDLGGMGAVEWEFVTSQIPKPPEPPMPPVIDMATLQNVIDKMADMMASFRELETLLRGLKAGAPPTEQPATTTPASTTTPPTETTGSTVAKNIAGGVAGIAGVLAAWYNNGIVDTTAVNSILGIVAGGALSAYAPLINLGLGLISRINLRPTATPPA